MLASDNFSQEQYYALFSKSECLFAALWNNPQGIASTETVANYYGVTADAIASVMQSHYEEFEEITQDNWTPRAALRLGFLLKSSRATEIRSLAIDVIEAHNCKDKRQQVTLLLQRGEFVQWSDREIARILQCSPTIVGRTRKELEAQNKILRFEKRKHTRDGKIIERENKDSIPSDVHSGHEQASNPYSTVETKLPVVKISFPGHPRDGHKGVIVDQRDDYWQKLIRFPDGHEEAIAEKYLDSSCCSYTPVSPTLEEPQRTYTEEELQAEIARALQEKEIGDRSSIREEIEADVREQLKAARAIASQRAVEVAKLQQRVEELESLRLLEAENELLKQRIQDLENSIEPRACQEWGNTYTKQAAKVLNADVKKSVENLEPDLHLRVMAKTAPQSNPRGTVNLLGLSLIAMANGHPRLAKELRKASAIVLDVKEDLIDAKKQQLEQLPQAIASFRHAIASSDWNEILASANQYPLIKQEVWLELTPSERAAVDSLKPWKNPIQWKKGEGVQGGRGVGKNDVYKESNSTLPTNSPLPLHPTPHTPHPINCKHQPLGQFHLIYNGDRWLVVQDSENFATPQDWLKAWEEGEAKEGVIALADNSMVAYNYHATVAEVNSEKNSIRLRWRERVDKPSEYEWFFNDDLEQLRVVPTDEN